MLAIMKVVAEIFLLRELEFSWEENFRCHLEYDGMFPCLATKQTLELVALYQLQDQFGGDNHCLPHPQLNCLQLIKHVACYPVLIKVPLDDLLTWFSQGVDKVTSNHLAWETPCPSLCKCARHLLSHHAPAGAWYFVDTN